MAGRGDHTTVPGQFPAQGLRAVLGGWSGAGTKPRNDDAISGRIPETAYEMQVKGAIACIADGISTGLNSDKAAQISVVQFARDYYSAPESWPVRDCAGRLLNSLNSWLHAQNRSGSPDAEGMVTTFTAAIARSTTLHIVHIGDTRCQRLRAGRLVPLTEDHSARFMGGSESLTRALGAEADIRVDYAQETMAEGDLYILTTDGVHDTLGEAGMRDRLAGLPQESREDLEAASRALCQAALEAGSSDNVSCMLLKILALPSETLPEAHRRLTAQVIPPAMKPGNRIDGWEVLEVMHSSTRSNVYLVRRAGEDGRFVLKAPSQNFAENLQYLEGFTLEQWVGRRITNSQVMKIRPHEDSRFLYYIADFVEGETLRDWMKAHPKPSIAEIIPVLASLISAVRVFHRLGMVHRDLKPENVIIAEDGTAKIIDFGSVQVSGFRDLERGDKEELPEGSLNYIAPEVLTGQGAQPLSDLFSVAAITWEMLAGRVPFDLEERTALPSRPADWAAGDFAALRPDLPPATGEVLSRALAFSPKDRPEVMSEFLGEMRKLQGRAGTRPVFVPLLQRGSRGFWRGWALAATAVAAALAVALVALLP
ncbi:bifunctional protein-serine/threonine kinase/phosphatase [Mangrovicoccus sp. HB161399]|uniref:bifunctional protein-serine/threonine kinase/phosphatase n=1 Tax=Mangrovicoccus sp. HB161399 TaxID=2720392 RepID=UPI001551D1A4|nr:bifunctional protein-serine/threonine kinase/phosphatase [Mangrovicoccus sp. HB161399]